MTSWADAESETQNYPIDADIFEMLQICLLNDRIKVEKNKINNCYKDIKCMLISTLECIIRIWRHMYIQQFKKKNEVDIETKQI